MNAPIIILMQIDQLTLIGIFGGFALLFFVVVFLLLHGFRKNMTQTMNLMSSNLAQSQGNMTDALSRSTTVIGDIQCKLGELEASTRHIQELGRDINSLQHILSAPKLRGNLGEYLLYELLKDVLPSSNYEEQYHFKDGLAVDAVVRLGKNLVPVDSKFPLESFMRYVDAKDSDSKRKAKSEFIKSIKARIDEIAKKYIRPAEGTFDFALMYVPAENVYYEIMVQDENKKFELFEYAMARKVIPVSPNTFYAYLLSIVYGLRGFKIEQQAQVIVNELSGIKKNLEGFVEEFAVLGKHLSQAEDKYSELNAKALKISGQLEKIAGC